MQATAEMSQAKVLRSVKLLIKQHSFSSEKQAPRSTWKMLHFSQTLPQNFTKTQKSKGINFSTDSSHLFQIGLHFIRES